MKFTTILAILLGLSLSCSLIQDDNLEILPTPVLEIPIDSAFLFYNDTAVAFPLTFHWQGTTTVNNYLLEIAEDDSFEVNLQTHEISILEKYNWQSPILRDTTQFYWRAKTVSPQEDNAESFYSEISTFTIGIPAEIICYKCGIYDCIADLQVTDDNIDTSYQNVPMTLSVVRVGESNQYSISYDLQVGGYQLSTSVTAYDHDEVYKILGPGHFAIGSYMVNVPNVGLTEIQSNWSFLNDPEIDGHLLYTGMQENLQVYCSFSGRK